jgi:hypothetical protein
MLKTYYFVFQYSPLLPLIYGFLHIHKLNLPLRLLLAWLSFSLSITIVMTILAKQGINNLWIMNLSLPIYTFFLLWIFSLWETKPRMVLLLRLSIVAFAIIWTFEMVFGDGLFKFTTYSRPIMDVMLVAVSCFALYEDNLNIEIPLIDRPRFWMGAGLILYYGGTLLVNLLSKHLLEISSSALQSALFLQPVLSFFAHILYTMGLRCQCRP